MAFDCQPGEVIEVDDLLTYIEENAVPGPPGEEGPPGEGVEDAYLLDGTQEIIAPFAGGAQVFKNAAPAVEANDLTTLKQVEDKLEIGVYNRPSRYAMNGKG